MRPRLLPTGAALLVLLGAFGCTEGADGDAPAPDTTAADPGPSDTDARSEEPVEEPVAEPEAPEPTEPVLDLVSVVAPIADLVARVGGERVAVTSLVPEGADSHTYEPRPQDVVGLGAADAFFGIGLGLNTASVDLARSALPEGAPVVLLGEELAPDALIDDDDHGHTHSHDDGHGHGPNPHVWTSVRNAESLVEAIVEALTELDPDGADGFAARGRALQAELRDLDDAIAAAVETIPAGERTLIAYHDAWSYFARDYGFDLVTAVQPSDYAEPSAGDVRAVVDLVREHGVAAVFGSEEFPNDVLQTIADETGATYVGDLTDDELPGAPGEAGQGYVEMMRRNAAVIVEALGGSTEPLGVS